MHVYVFVCVYVLLCVKMNRHFPENSRCWAKRIRLRLGQRRGHRIRAQQCHMGLEMDGCDDHATIVGHRDGGHRSPMHSRLDHSMNVRVTRCFCLSHIHAGRYCACIHWLVVISRIFMFADEFCVIRYNVRKATQAQCALFVCLIDFVRVFALF